MKVQFKHIIKKSKVDFFIIVGLSLIIILTRIFFMENFLEQLIFVDSYRYITNAIFLEPFDISHGSFVSFVSLIYPSNMNPNDAITFIRLIMIVFSIQLVLFFYLILKNFFSHLFALIGGLFVIFLPIFLLYSTTLHNDIFALSMAFTALYISIRFKNLLGLSLASIFVLLASTTRIESAIFVIPILISFSKYLSRKIGIKFHIILTALLTVFFGIGFVASQELDGRFYYFNQFDSPFHQLLFYLTPKNFIMVFNSVFNITENELINHLFLIVV